MGHDVSVSVETQGDDWDTDPDFVVSRGINFTGTLGVGDTSATLTFEGD